MRTLQLPSRTIRTHPVTDPPATTKCVHRAITMVIVPFNIFLQHKDQELTGPRYDYNSLSQQR
jgi:hypothetical protein